MLRPTGVVLTLTRVVTAGLLSGCAGAAPADPAATASAAPVSPVSRDVSSGAPATGCGVNLSAPAVRDAVAGLPAEPVTGARWSTDPASFDGNFDPCATLSTAIVPIRGATGSSPEHALMFHQGHYLGTATSKAYGFTSLATAASTADTVALNYKTPGSCNACSDGTTTQVKFRWDRTRVVMIGNPPR